VLNLISGLTHPDTGKVLICGEELTGPNDKAATVPQAYTCFPWLSVLKNVELGMKICGDPPDRQERKERAEEYLGKVGLIDRKHARPKELSGGMQQRVAIARTLVLKPKIVLMDEPFGALDAQTRAGMQQMLLRLWEEERSLIIFVTHDINEALLLADEVIVFPMRPVIEIKTRIINVKEELRCSETRASGPRTRNAGHPEFARLAAELREALKCEEESESPLSADEESELPLSADLAEETAVTVECETVRETARL
jgi:NitT/TauT family transport system ATP-binding protein